MIIPLLLHHGESEWSIGLRFSDLILYLPEELKPYVPEFSYLLCDLYSIDDDKIRGIAIIRITLLLLKYIHHPDFPYYLQRILPLLKDLLQPGQGLSHLESIIRYIFYATDRVSVDELKKMVDEHLTKDKEELIMTLAEQLVQQGMQKGKQVGIQEGLQRAILDVLEARFGSIPLSLREKLAGIADGAVLENLLKKAVVVTSADELEKKIPVNISNLS